METETTVSTIKLINQDLVRLDCFDGSNFTRWQDKLRFLLISLKIIYILDPDLPPLPEPTDEDTDEVKASIKQREDDELIYRGHILNALSNKLYDLYTNTKSAKEIWTPWLSLCSYHDCVDQNCTLRLRRYIYKNLYQRFVHRYN
ncbi:hypothetical protein UlMin_036728 [Ulmus minor]